MSSFPHSPASIAYLAALVALETPLVGSRAELAPPELKPERAAPGFRPKSHGYRASKRPSKLARVLARRC